MENVTDHYRRDEVIDKQSPGVHCTDDFLKFSQVFKLQFSAPFLYKTTSDKLIDQTYHLTMLQSKRPR